jgi:hypothetical protein
VRSRASLDRHHALEWDAGHRDRRRGSCCRGRPDFFKIGGEPCQPISAWWEVGRLNAVNKESTARMQAERVAEMDAHAGFQADATGRGKAGATGRLQPGRVVMAEDEERPGRRSADGDEVGLGEPPGCGPTPPNCSWPAPSRNRGCRWRRRRAPLRIRPAPGRGWRRSRIAFAAVADGDGGKKLPCEKYSSSTAVQACTSSSTGSSGPRLRLMKWVLEGVGMLSMRSSTS